MIPTRLNMAANFIKKPPVALRWLLMDAPEARLALEKVPWKSPLVPLKVLDSMLRGIAQVAYGNSPLCGLLILIGLCIGNVYSGAGAILCSLTTIFMAKLLNWSDEQIAAGHCNFNAVLIGTVTPAVYPAFFHKDAPPPELWGYLILAAIFTVCVMGGLGRIMERHNIPALTMPFNIAVGTTFVCMKMAAMGDLSTTLPTKAPGTPVDVEWGQVFRGTLLAAGQVWGVQDCACSALVYIALFLFSPTLVFTSYIGATLGSLTGILFAGEMSAVYDGIWGYNGFLSGGAISFLMVPTPRVLLVAAINAVFATFIQAALLPVFAANGLPVFTFPFCLATILFLATAMATGPKDIRVSNPTFPELHYVKYYEKTKTTKENDAKELDEAITEPMV